MGIDVALVSNLAAASHGPDALDADEVVANMACATFCSHRTRLLPLYWVRPGRTDSHVRALRGAMLDESFFGAVLAPQLNDFSADADMLDPYLLVLARLGRPALVHCGRDERAAPARVYALARRHPDVSFILYGALADIHRAESLDAARHAAERGDARLILDVARATPEVVLGAIRRLGARQLVFGSSTRLSDSSAAPQPATTGTPDEAPAALSPASFDALRRELPAEAWNRIAGETASALFGLNEPRRHELVTTD
jgi:predicted TIM-barrel fold metal-dependent hydrolase